MTSWASNPRAIEIWHNAGPETRGRRDARPTNPVPDSEPPGLQGTGSFLSSKGEQLPLWPPYDVDPR